MIFEKNSPCTDHLGNEFNSFHAMCEYYGQNSGNSKKMLESGKSLEEVLTRTVIPQSKKVTDHLGNEFDSETEMCKYWGVSRGTYRSRLLDLGWSQEKALTYKPNMNKDIGYVTINGKKYISFRKAADTLKVHHSTLKRIVTTYPDIPHNLVIEWLRSGEKVKSPVKDHEGNYFPSFTKMCEFYGKSNSRVSVAIKNGFSLKDALTIDNKEWNKIYGRKKSNSKKETVYDHLGNPYPSLKEMCEHYGISETAYRKRSEKGLTLEEILTLPLYSPLVKIKSASNVVYDHKGEAYPSFNAMCNAYGRHSGTAKRKLERGASLEEVLTGFDAIDIRHEKFGKYKDKMIYNGKEYDSPYFMYDDTGVSPQTLISGWDKGFTTEEIKYIVDNGGRVTSATRDHNGKLFPSMKQMCKFYHKAQSQVQDMLDNGASLEDALLYSSKMVIDHKGNKYPGLKDMCEAYGVPVSYYHAWKDKKSLEDILEGYKKKDTSITIRGIEYSSLGKALKALNISSTGYYPRIDKGMTREEAIEDMLKEKESKGCYDHKGIYYESFFKMCKAYNKKANGVKFRLDKGMSLKEALETPLYGEITDYKGQVFKSTPEMCKYYNIPVYAFRHRIEKGWPLKCALLYPIWEMDEEHKELKILCEKFGLVYSNAYSYYKKKGVSPKEVILHFKPDLKLNLFGEIVEDIK